VGDLTGLTTTDKTSVNEVKSPAVNEVKAWVRSRSMITDLTAIRTAA
jgi:hypothetical protein